jgi:hypothetical protein
VYEIIYTSAVKMKKISVSVSVFSIILFVLLVTGCDAIKGKAGGGKLSGVYYAKDLDSSLAASIDFEKGGSGFCILTSEVADFSIPLTCKYSVSGDTLTLEMSGEYITFSIKDSKTLVGQTFPYTNNVLIKK